MKNLIKPLILSALIGLPMITAASAGPVSDLQDKRQEIRDELWDKREDLKNALRNEDWDAAREARAEIAREEARLDVNSRELTRFNALPEDEFQPYYLKSVTTSRTSTASPFDSEHAPQYMYRYDSISGRPYYVRINP